MKILLKEIADLQSEFETERQDYLETIRKQEMHVKLLSQIAEKIARALKKECNYRWVFCAARKFAYNYCLLGI